MVLAEAFEFVDLALEGQKAAFGNHFAVITQAKIKLLLPAIDTAHLEAVEAAELVDGRASVPLLEDGELLFCGNPAAATAFNRWSLVD